MDVVAELRPAEAEREDPGAGAANRTGKAIVVLSDGTGNSSAKLARTNVWRLYQAIDGAEPDERAADAGGRRQVAYYDDGVGTSSFRPLAVLGGVFGWGLKRNVLDLYTFICRNHEKDDRIYAFGFSRGAFTVRIVADLVAQQGVLRCGTERELTAYARDAYRAYRACFHKERSWVSRFRRLRDSAIARWRRRQGLKPYGEVRKEEVGKIRFVGVWDTVAAYGLPLTEMTRGIDKWVWPMSMPNYRLSPKVEHARHALALDDERDTFHPLLWDEVEERRMVESGEVEPGRMLQVWFAGMHSDVGGGYADDALAHVPLHWMMSEAEAAGLRFKQRELEDVERARDGFGPMHDSRRGLGGYYRYQPRKIGARLEKPDATSRIMQDPEIKDGPGSPARGLLTSVKVHRSVLDRIERGTDRYAPVVLPAGFQVVRPDRTIEDAPEAPRAAELRMAGQEKLVWNDVWRRRVSYFATVFLSLVLAALPLIQLWWPPSACVGPQCVVTPAILGLGNLLPGIVEPWFRAFARAPGWSFGLALAIASLLLWSGGVQRRIQDRMHGLWRASLLPDAPAAAVTDRPSPHERTDAGREGRIHRFRTGERYQGFFRWLKWRGVPAVFGWSVRLCAPALAVFLALVLAARVEVAYGERAGGSFCNAGSGQAREASPGPDRPAVFATNALCWDTGTEVVEGERYRVSLRVVEPWFDGAVETSPSGTAPGAMPFLARFVGALFRRVPSGHWFQPFAKVASEHGHHIQALEMRPSPGQDETFAAVFTAGKTGRLHLFVSDAFLPSWLARAFRLEGQPLYADNTGTAVATVQRVNGARAR
jgi:uncharacterized protein (DUF2235 family)